MEITWERLCECRYPIYCLSPLIFDFKLLSAHEGSDMEVKHCAMFFVKALCHSPDLPAVSLHGCIIWDDESHDVSCHGRAE